MQNKEKLIDRIRKLLALGKSSNQHEAELAMAKVNELMKEHQLSMSEIDVKEVGEQKAKAGQEKAVSETYRSFVRRIAKAAGLLFDTGVVKTEKQSGFFFIGLPEDIIASEILFDYLFESWKSIVGYDSREWKTKVSWGTEPIRQYEVKQFKIGHGQGFADAVYSRAAKLAYERKQSVKATSTGTELVIVKKALVDDYIKNYTSPIKGRGYSDQGSGYGTGHERGKAIPLSGALTKDKKERLT